jgi:CelD/BcsL family acetyltransferase involved in cellulose biosynthesis
MRPFHENAFAAGKVHAGLFAPLMEQAPLLVELRRPVDLSQQERRRWTELSLRAAPGNIFAADWIMEPALRHHGTTSSLRLAIVRTLAGDWVGVLPMTLKASIDRRPVPSWQGWHAPSPSIGTPLVLPGAEKAFWQALLDHFDRRPGLALGLFCSAMPDDLAVTLALASLCAEQGRRLHHLDSFTRPARRTVPFPDPGPAMIAATRALDQELDQIEARLTDTLGPVSLVLHESTEDCEPWLAAFFALERAGERARAARAKGITPATSALFRDVVRHGSRRGVARLASLRAGEQIVAMTCWLTSGRYGYGLRMAHDETMAHFVPDRLLMRRVARMTSAEPLVLFDSCAPRGTECDPLWPDQRRLGGIAVGIGSAPRRKLFDALVDARQR